MKYHRISECKIFDSYIKVLIRKHEPNTPLCEIMGRNKSDKGDVNYVISLLNRYLHLLDTIIIFKLFHTYLNIIIYYK